MLLVIRLRGFGGETTEVITAAAKAATSNLGCEAWLDPVFER